MGWNIPLAGAQHLKRKLFVITRITRKKDLQAIRMILLSNTKIRRPFTMRRYFIDLEFVSLAEASKSTVYYLARIHATLRKLVHRVMSSKDIFAVLVDQKPSMCRKGMPDTPKVELLSKLSRTEMHEVESSWSRPGL